MCVLGVHGLVNASASLGGSPAGPDWVGSSCVVVCITCTVHESLFSIHWLLLFVLFIIRTPHPKSPQVPSLCRLVYWGMTLQDTILPLTQRWMTLVSELPTPMFTFKPSQHCCTYDCPFLSPIISSVPPNPSLSSSPHLSPLSSSPSFWLHHSSTPRFSLQNKMILAGSWSTQMSLGSLLQRLYLAPSLVRTA